MVDLSEIVAIWRGETKRALKSGRVLVLLILFLMFVGLALTVVGGFQYQATAQFEQQAAKAGADMSQVQTQFGEQKKQFLKMFVTEDERMLEALASIPIVLLVVFKLTLRFLPLFIALMGFDQLAGEVGPKSMRFLIVRVKRSSIILGKLLSQATIFAMLLSICTLLMVIVARVLNPDFAASQVALWTAKLIVSSLVLSLAYLALTALFSSLTRQSGIALVLNVIALFVIWSIALWGEFYRFPGEEAAMNTLAQFKDESWRAYIRYASVWHYGDDLLHPSWARALPAALAHLGYGLVFLGIAQLALKKRDL
ncbi:MAG: ABC transporter permease subunit [Archangium sp.]